MTDAPRYSILITSFRSLRFLEECLGSLQKLQGPEFEVLFLDNGSPEPEYEWVRDNIQDPRFHAFKVDRTGFFTGGVNYLAKRAQGEFLVLLNSDAKAEPDWLQVMDAYLRETGYEAAGSEVDELALAAPHGDVRWCLDPFGLIHYIPAETLPEGPHFMAGGCGMVIRRDVFFEVGALDDTYKMYFEEMDLGWRINLRNYRIGHAKGALIHHVGQGSSRSGFFAWNRFRGRRNRIWTFLKNAGPGMLAVFIPAHLFLCLASILWNLVTGKFRYALAEAAALGAAILKAGPALSKRRAIQASRKVSDAQLIAKGFIVLRIKGLGWIFGGPRK